MMSVGLHCRIIGRPGRIRALDDFVAYAKAFPEVWFATRLDIARWWRQTSEEHAEPSGSDRAAGTPATITRVELDDVQPTRLGGGASSRILLSAANVLGATATLGCSVFPAGAVSDSIIHDTEEWMYIIAGAGELRTDSASVSFAAGVALHIPAGVWHSVANTGSEDVAAVFGFPAPTYPKTQKRGE